MRHAQGLCVRVCTCFPWPHAYSYCRESADGVDPETEFMFDLEVPSDFIPQPLDGEVSQYYLWNIEQAREYFL